MKYDGTFYQRVLDSFSVGKLHSYWELPNHSTSVSVTTSVKEFRENSLRAFEFAKQHTEWFAKHIHDRVWDIDELLTPEQLASGVASSRQQHIVLGRVLFETSKGMYLLVRIPAFDLQVVRHSSKSRSLFEKLGMILGIAHSSGMKTHRGTELTHKKDQYWMLFAL